MVRNTPKRTIKEVDETIRKYLVAYKDENYDRATAIMGGLIDDFTPYIDKFVRLSKSTTNKAIYNKDTQQFLSLFLPQNRRRPIDMVSAKSFYQSILERFEPEDIFNELVALFIELANKFDPTYRIGFTHYITQYMKWEIQRWVTKIKDEPLLGMRPVYEYVEDLNPDEVALIPNLDVPVMNLDWVFECNKGPFSLLSGYERYLLYMKFKEDKSSGEIANKFQKSRQTIMKHINEAIEKVAIIMKKGE